MRHGLTAEISKQCFGSYSGAPAHFAEKCDAIITTWLDQKALEISMSHKTVEFVDGTKGFHPYQRVKEILGLKNEQTS